MKTFNVIYSNFINRGLFAQAIQTLPVDSISFELGIKDSLIPARRAWRIVA
jgi:hypothetical protein